MQDYKIIIPSANISMSIIQEYPIPEISYQDFLRLGEIDVNNCKIRIPSGNIIFDLREKLESLGVRGYGNSPAIRVYGYPYYTDLHGSSRPTFMYVKDGLSSMIGTKEYFNSRPEKEATVEQIMQLQTTINNTITNQMSEITLKCITEPQKAKNITEGRDYTGILIDSDDTQVDSLREAKYFRCVNNNGIEAKYRLSLFASIEPPTPPAPPKITQQGLIDSLIVDQEDVSAMYNGNRFTVVDFGLSCLDMSDVNCSCGIKSCNGLDSLFDSIYETDWEHISEIVSDFNEGNFEMDLFKSIVKGKIDNYNVAMVLFSTTENEEVVCNWMDSICDERNGWQTDVRRNPNSGNTIKAWLIPKI